MGNTKVDILSMAEHFSTKERQVFTAGVKKCMVKRNQTFVSLEEAPLDVLQSQFKVMCDHRQKGTYDFYHLNQMRARQRA